MRGARALAFVTLTLMSTGCDQYTETTNSDFFVLFGNGLADAVNNSSARANVAVAPGLPLTEYYNSSVACQRGQLQIVTSITTNINPQSGSGYVDINSTAHTIPAPGNNDDFGCVVDDTDISGYLQLLATATVTGGQSIPPVLYVTGAWNALGCNCTTSLSVSTQSGWNGHVCGAPVVSSTIQGPPSC